MNPQELFVEAVRSMDELPKLLRKHASDFRGLEEHRVDQSYIEFLDTQIRLEPRGPEWTERLIRRRAVLLPFCGVTLLHGFVDAGYFLFSVEIHPETKTVIHWEEYEKTSPHAPR